MKMRPITPKATLRLGHLVGVSAGLGLAAAPTFALMAGISAIGSPGMAMCSSAPAFMPLNEMALMYLLMAFFHLPAWLKFLSAGPQHADTPVTQTKGD